MQMVVANANIIDKSKEHLAISMLSLSVRPWCQAEPEGGSRGLIYIEIGTEIIEGLRG